MSSDDVLPLMTPCTKLKMGKAYIEKAKVSESAGDRNAALTMFKKAARLIPENRKLEKKISSLEVTTPDKENRSRSSANVTPISVKSPDETSSGKEDAVGSGNGKQRLILSQITSEVRQAFERDLLERLNEGDLKTITSLKGIGKKRAQKILEHRQEHGKLARFYDLTNLGFGDKLVNTILKANLLDRIELQ